jgi:signal recognition particle receptor subunit beta
MGFESPTPVRTGAEELRAHNGQLNGRAHGEEAIGAPLEEARVRLLQLIERVDGLLGEYATPLLDAARNQLEQRPCRVAVVGQIKAGKSTFINALCERPGFLPADINPWTAVVSALHFRKAAEPPEHAAVFHLFSADEWQQLADGGGRLRELTERLVPGFQSDLLRAQLEVMRKRAERRLGAKFAELLGKCHRFKTVTPEILADYVSAGDDSVKTNGGPNGGPNGSGARRLYSDITRSADLYFNDSPFAYPMTLIDTPGTNDPFMVRDEITRRSLENPDIYVFVISALQPLSAADIGMLRLLNGLHKDRIVVFINRADQLPNPNADAAAIKAAVERRLRAEFPALRIPVIYGSAWLGSLRLQTESAGLYASLKPALVKALRQAGLPASIDATSDHLSNVERSRVAVAMHMSSGMSEMSAAITRLMCSSSIAMLLRQIALCLSELVRSAEVSDKAELQSIHELLEARREETGALRSSIAEEQKSLAAFEARADALQASFQEIESHFSAVIASASQMLRHQLRDLVRAFADDQADAMLGSLETDRKQKTWRCDVAPLREQLEGAYLAAFEQAAADLAHVERFLYPQLKVIVASLLPGYRGNLLEVPAWPPGLMPTIAPLADKVSMDLGASWWRQWFAVRRAAQERAGQLRQLIEEDFLRIADELVGTAEEHLQERVDYIMQRVNAIGMGLRTGLERRSANLEREQTLLGGSGDERSLERFESEQRLRAEGCVQKQDAYATCLDELGSIVQALDGAHGETGLQ